ncbi:conserved protein of unknown function [Paraburkholderia kururiensis]|uniref:hypothetical protein n=1 Tax=Paraburkholderia kururiensis TaxID=984307 RepID=UPI0039A43082
MNSLFDLLEKLDDARIHYTLSRSRPETVLVSVTVVGMRIEIDVFRDGHAEVCIFSGSEGEVGGLELLDEIIRNNRD